MGKAVALFAFAWPAHISMRQAGTLALTLTPIVVSGIAILHLLGPIATRYALIRAGEGEPGARE